MTAIRTGLIAATIAITLAAATSLLAQRPAPVEPRAVAPRGPLLAAEQSVVKLFESTAPSVAYINTERLEPTSFFTVGVAKGAGSGFVWDHAGHIVTNYHVVEGARNVQVQLDAGRTDAAINPGNSGGPLLDSAGRLVGVTSAIRSPSGGSSGVGLAIPVDLVNRIVPQLIARGRAPQPSIGIVPIHPDLVASAGITGVVLERVVPGTPAAQAGLVPYNRRSGNLGDVIIAVNGRSVESLPTFGAELDRVGIDNIAELTVIRDGKERHVRVKVIDIQG